MRRSPDRVSLVAGVALLVLGTVLLLDRLEAIDVRFGSLAPVLLGTVGAILLASGLQRHE
jgi:hypothetical protein